MAPIDVLKAEAKGVELGYIARRNNDGSYSVRSETREGLDHEVHPVILSTGFIRYECACEAGEARPLDLIPCWHAARVAHRHEREGFATWSPRFGGSWAVTDAGRAVLRREDAPDPFDLPEVVG